MGTATKPAVRKPVRRKPAVDRVEAALDELLANGKTVRARKPKSEPASSSKPAAKKPARPATKPAAGVTIASLAEHLGIDDRTLRARIRRHFGGAQVGKGGRYGWKNMQDPEVKQIVALFKK